MTNSVLRRALECAAHGWPVFPCQPGRKAPATRHGHLDATTDADQIRDWFTRPGQNLAVAHVRTPSGGLHIYFAGTSQRSAHLPNRHIDFLAQGGYALIPPSRVGGRTYQHIQIQGAEPGSLDWSAAVRLLEPARDLRPPAPRHAPEEQIGALARWVADQREGNRNAGLFWAANRALETDQAADLSPLAAAAREAGLDEPEITCTLNSARRTTQPRPESPGHQAEGAS